MIPLEKILSIASPAEFELAALEIFAFQARECLPYRDYLSLIGVEPAAVRRVEDIPFLPIEIFRTHRVYCGADEPQLAFTSSATGGDTPSRHFMACADDYRATFRTAFERFYPGKWSIYALLPNYLQREGSSLVYMVDDLIRKGGGGFYLDNIPKMLEDIKRDTGQKILLGVSYALWDMAERYDVKLSGTVVMETGGMKGRREELPKREFHRLLCDAFGVERIASEYGMAELASQAYSSGDGIFRAPPWMKTVVRELADPFACVETGRTGGINIIDLANRYSCAFIQTDDLGRLAPDGSFEIVGRAGKSAIRGCNLLIQ